ncbi:MAG: transporter substrate-binding domain-containing protein [Chloroflexi bacterium]|nr:transporter substrate-binding domain-containing protein [Chloroflexota bacterium]
MPKAILALCLLLTVSTALAQPETEGVKPGPTLNSILARGVVACGVNQEVLGFGYLDPNTGELRGLEVDLCRALAAAIFGDATAAQLVPYVDDSGLDALEQGELDVLLHTVVWALSADANPRLDFGPAMFYGGQSFLVQASSGLADWPDLDGAVICVAADSVAAASLPAAMTSRGLNFQPLELPSADEAVTALIEGQCQAYTANLVELETARQRAADPGAYVVWQGRDHIYTQEPFAPVYRSDDPQWRDLVNWTLLGLIAAEELGVSSENVLTLSQQPGEQGDDYITRVGPNLARFLGETTGLGSQLALPNDFMAAAVREVGNYGEIFNRYLGLAGDLVIERDLNALWRDGGLLVAPVWR